ncbi:MAG: transcription elongation factor subunit Spt4 [Candidatus Aenigmatarchaeota archaeon]
MAKEKACKNCRRLVKGNVCPACKTDDLTTGWKGLAIILDPESEIAEKMDIKAPGRYAIKMR